MKSILYLFLLCSPFIYSFEGIVSCKKIEKGVETNFKFYVKGNQIAIVSGDESDNTKILFDRSANIMKIVVDDMDPSKKGYYELNQQNAQKYHSVKILDQFKLDSKEINGVKAEGFGVKTDQGSATAYFGTIDINLTGFSTFFNDPVYEVIDASKNSKLPIELRVTSPASSYVIYLSAEASTLSDSFFQIPSGFRKFEVKAE